jgi:exodeoxyribonuclease III
MNRIRMNIATFNVNGIRARGKEVSLWAYAEKPQVLCLQEIKAAPDQIEADTCSLPGYTTHWHGQKGGYSGVSLHIRKELGTPRFYVPDFDMETRVVVAELENMDIACVYAPNGGKDYDAKIAFYRAMIAWTHAHIASGKQLVLAGDLNIAHRDIDLHKSHRKPDVIGQRPEERLLFDELLACGLVDTGRALNPDSDKMFTWWPYWKAARPRNLGWRIDYVLATEQLAKTCTAATVKAEIGTSDHAPFMATFG